jgi:hypothetical protein
MATKVCARCSTPMSPTILDSAAGEAAPFTLRLCRMPVLSCSAGHRRFLRPQFARELVESLFAQDEARIPAGAEKGLLFKRYYCGCGAELGKNAERRETYGFDVALAGSEPFRVELTAPVYRCPKCSREQLHSLKELRSRTPQALAEAFRAAGIPPPA